MSMRREAENVLSRLKSEAGEVVLSSANLSTGDSYVVVRPFGILGGADLEATCRELTNLDGLDPQTPVLWDFRAFDFQAHDPGACRANARILNRFPERRGARRALLMSSEGGYGHGRMAQGVIGSCGIDDASNFFVSRSLDDCLQWLAEPV